jgi:hypothetical protein
MLTKDDLITAYERAGRAFQGQLENNFVVLNDDDQATLVGPVTGAPSGSGRGKGGARGKGKGRGGGGATTGANSTPRGSGSSKSVKRAGSKIENSASKK